MRIAIVLGAGGSPAWAFHIGVLEGFCDATGRDPAGADLIVGTSAGSAIAASAKAGATTSELMAAITTPPSTEERAALRAEMAATRRPLVTRFLPLDVRLTRHLLPGGAGFPVALAGVLPRGQFPTTHLGRFPGVSELDGWPDGLWLPAVRVGDQRLVVFGRDRRDVSVEAAVQASSAVPGMFQPKQLNDEAYIDGATRSPTHADIVLDTAPDVVVVSSVQTRPGLRPSRLIARDRLRSEIARLREAGTRSIVVEPDDAAAELFQGFPRNGLERGPLIAAAAADRTRAALAAL